MEPEINPQTLFEMTGIFDQKRAMDRFNRAAGMFMMALKDMGGQVDEGPGLGIVWAGALKLPPKGFILMLTVMRKIGWIDRTMKADKDFCLLLTPKGHLRAEWYRLMIERSKNQDADGDDD